VALDDERPSAWGAPAPSHADADESTGPATEESVPEGYEEAPQTSDGSTAYRRAGEPPDSSPERSPQLAASAAYQDPGYQDPRAGAHGWEAAAPVLVSDDGSGQVNGGGPTGPRWPPVAGHAVAKKRREHRVLRGIRSGVALTVIALALGVAAAAALGLVVWLIATAIHHAAAN
jgi:hypothetical protein